MKTKIRKSKPRKFKWAFAGYAVIGNGTICVGDPHILIQLDEAKIHKLLGGKTFAPILGETSMIVKPSHGDGIYPIHIETTPRGIVRTLVVDFSVNRMEK